MLPHYAHGAPYNESPREGVVARESVMEISNIEKVMHVMYKTDKICALLMSSARASLWQLAAAQPSFGRGQTFGSSSACTLQTTLSDRHHFLPTGVPHLLLLVCVAQSIPCAYMKDMTASVTVPPMSAARARTTTKTHAATI